MVREPVCGFTFDGIRCRRRGPHRCLGRVRHVLAFFVEALVHTKGDYAGQPFWPAPWQRDKVLAPLFGEVIFDERRGRYVRRYRVLYLSVARKNGKTELLAGIVLYLLVADGEFGAEIYGLALDMSQAGLVYHVCRQMVRRNVALKDRLHVLPGAGRIVDEATGSFYSVVASDPEGNLGLNPSGGYIDELLTQPNRDLYDAIRTGMGTRAQPLLCLATTAEANETSFAATERTWSERIADNPDLEPERLVVMYSAHPDHDWTLPATWREANPALGDFLEYRTIASECRAAQNNPVEERAFRQFRLNQPPGSVGLAINMPSWDASAGIQTWDDLAQLCEGRECFGGLDLAAASDLGAYALVFPDGDDYLVIWRHFVPAAGLLEFGRRTAGLAPVWVAQGLLTVTEGNVLDYAVVKAHLEADRERFQITELAFGRWQAIQLAGELAEEEWPMIPFGQGYAAHAGATSEVLRAIATGRFHHGGNPVARWQASNAVTRTDTAGNIRFDKGRSRERIEGMVAAVMGIDRAIRHVPEEPKSKATAGFR